MTGPQLAEALDRLLSQRPDLSRSKVGMIIRGKRNGIDDLRQCIKRECKPETVAKVFAFIADPPAEARYIPPSERKPRVISYEKNQRRIAAIRRSVTRGAQDRVDRGLSAESASQATVCMAQRDLEQKQRELARLHDPVEQALLKVRRRRIVFRASVYGGEHNRFYISGRGRETISEDELLELAQQVAA